MSRHVRCDRCGADVPPGEGPALTRDVLVRDWKGDGSIQPPRVEPITITVQFYGKHLDGDGATPDLCRDCKGWLTWQISQPPPKQEEA